MQEGLFCSFCLPRSTQCAPFMAISACITIVGAGFSFSSGVSCSLYGAGTTGTSVVEAYVAETQKPSMRWRRYTLQNVELTAHCQPCLPDIDIESRPEAPELRLARSELSSGCLRNTAG